MTKCEGPGHEPGERSIECPNNARGKKVKFSIGDMYLCDHCERMRIDREKEKKKNANQNARRANEAHNNSATPMGSDKPGTIINPVLAYMSYCLIIRWKHSS